MDLRAHWDVEAISTPIGYIPKYPDLKRLFKEVLDKDYTEQEYTEQFTIRVNENIAKMERIIAVYKGVKNTPATVFEHLEAQKKRLLELKAAKGDHVTPDKL
jgi:phosphoenolpyruvate carboxykinase (GTP)